MDGNTPHIGDARAPIRQLDDAAINRIAAGEVIERPSSAVKELVENALDAGASSVDVDIADGGKTLIRVRDDGCGIATAELPLALSRHATSKIDGSDLLDIRSFGFRGEALASLAGVSRLSIVSRTPGEEGAEIRAAGGVVEPLRPVGAQTGTTVEVRDLFFATPARLKFLRTDRAETQAVLEVVKRLAMAAPEVKIRLRDLTNTPRSLLDLSAHQGPDAGAKRLRDILGPGFSDNAVALHAHRDGLHLGGFAALPTYSRGAAVQQYIVVNGRPVRDRMMLGALRAAYSDLLSRDRHPAAVVFITCDPNLVDVNVHPAKSEVRFREPGVARGLVVSGIRHALAEAGHRASTTVANAVLGALSPAPAAPRVYQMDRPSSGLGSQPGFAEASLPSARIEPAFHDVPSADGPLGAARAQVHENYIIAQTKRGIVIVDQHAAHERLVYERLKAERSQRGVARQMLLVPDIVEIGETEAARLLAHADALAGAGLIIEAFGSGAVAVQETPAILGAIDGTALVADILDELADVGASTSVSDRVDAILSRVACHGSIRSGRQMRAEEMNALLREMEETPNSGQCNHGRPTYVELQLHDIERLFGRT